METIILTVTTTQITSTEIFTEPTSVDIQTEPTSVDIQTEPTTASRHYPRENFSIKIAAKYSFARYYDAGESESLLGFQKPSKVAVFSERGIEWFLKTEQMVSKNLIYSMTFMASINYEKPWFLQKSVSGLS
jgi:hypothetical protein